MAIIADGKYIIGLDTLSSIALDAWIPFQPDGTPTEAFKISLTNFINALPILPAVAGEYANIAAMLAAQAGQTADVFYKVADPSDDPDYNDLKNSEIKSVYYHLVDVKTASLSDYNSIAIPKLESSKFPKLGNSLDAVTFDVKFRAAEWSSNEATLQAISNALKLDSPQDLLLSAESIKLLTDNAPADVSRVLFGSDGQLIFEALDAADIQSDTDATDVTLNDAYQLLLSITPNQQIIKGIAEIGVTAKSFSTAAITAFQASGNNRVRATSAAHGLSEGDYVEIINTANYNDIVEIKAVPNLNDFDFTATFVVTETGDWEKSENREIAIDLRVDSVSQKEFTRTIEGEARLNFSDQLSEILITEDIDVYVKSNTLGEAIEVIGTSDASELKVINSNSGNELGYIDYYVASWGDDGTAKPGIKNKPWALASAASLAAKADKDTTSNNNRVYILSGGAIYDNEINQNDIPIFAEDQAVVWTDVAGRSILSDRTLGSESKTDVSGGGIFVHTNPNPSNDQQGINFRGNGAIVNVQCKLIDSIQMWGTFREQLNLKDCTVLVGTPGNNRQNVDIIYERCWFGYGIILTNNVTSNSNTTFIDCISFCANIYDTEIYDKEGNLITTVDVSNLIANRLANAYAWRCPVVGVSGNGDVSIAAVNYAIVFNTSEEQTVDDFVDTHEAALLTVADQITLKRWKEITLTGTSGTATITLAGTPYLATFNTDLETTASDFVTSHWSAIATQGYAVVQFGDILAFYKTSEAAFTLTIANVSGDLNGTISYEFYLRALYDNEIDVSYAQSVSDLTVTFEDYYTQTELENRISTVKGEYGYSGIYLQDATGSDSRSANITILDTTVLMRKSKSVGAKIIYRENEIDGKYGGLISRNLRFKFDTSGSASYAPFIWGKDDALSSPAEIDIDGIIHDSSLSPREITASGYSAPVIRSNDPSIDNYKEVNEEPTLFKGAATANATAADTIKAFTATPIFDLKLKGNDHQMDVEGNVSAFTTTGEVGSGKYSVYLINDATVGWAVAAPVGDGSIAWTADPTSETHTTAANAINLYQFYTLPDGSKYYNIHIVKS